MADVRVQCCGICGCALEHYDGRTGVKAKHARKEGLVISFGWSRGGWGQREDAIDLAEEVCSECFEASKPVYDAMVKLLRDRGGREGYPSPVWENESSPEGRRKLLRSMLRALPR